MAEITFNYQIPPKSIGGFLIDAMLWERYKFSCSATDIPMEDGSIASDHVVENALEISISGFIGQAEFTVWGGSGSGGRDPKERIRATYLELLRLKSERQPLDVVTGLDTYPNMVIIAFEIDRNAANGKDLPFEMTLKQIRIVKSETTTITASTPSADQIASTANMGVAGTSRTDPESNRSKEEWRHAVRNGMATRQEYERKWGRPFSQ